MYRAYASPSCLRTAPFQMRAIIVPPRPCTSPPVVGAIVVFRIQEVAVRRAQVIEVLRGALLPLAWVNAAWLGGSDAFGRADELSDVDLQVDVDDGHVAATFGVVEAAPGRRLPDRGPAGDADADLARARPAVLPAPRHRRVHRRRRGRVPAVRPAPVLQPDRAPRPPPAPVRPGRGRPARPPRPGRAARHPGQGGRRHPGGAAVHPAPGGQGGPPA